MDRFLEYVDNPGFVRWVLHPDEVSSQYREKWLEAHPGEKEDFEAARMVVQRLVTEPEAIDPALTDRLFREFSCSVQCRNELSQKERKRFRIAPFLKYAAVPLLFFAFGVLFYSQFGRQSLVEQFPMVSETGNMDEARLVLPGGQHIPLNEKESVVEYGHGGDIVINHSDTVKSVSGKQVPEMNQLVIPYGKNSIVRLSDGTLVHLNSGSRLIYPGFFEGKSREVLLFGEAFFEVTPMKDKPFIVRTNEISVEVLGTRFNISAYPSESSIETVLVEGEVKITGTRNKLFGKEYLLRPNEMACFNRETEETLVKSVDITNYVSWHLGYLNFTSEDLSRIVKRVERYFDINVKLENPMHGQLKISGKLKLKENKDILLNVVASAASLELVKINEKYYVMR